MVIYRSILLPTGWYTQHIRTRTLVASTRVEPLVRWLHAAQMVGRQYSLNAICLPAPILCGRPTNQIWNEFRVQGGSGFHMANHCDKIVSVITYEWPALGGGDTEIGPRVVWGAYSLEAALSTQATSDDDNPSVYYRSPLAETDRRRRITLHIVLRRRPFSIFSRHCNERP